MVNKKFKSAIGILLVIIFFILVSYLVQSNLDFIKSYIKAGISSMIIYVLILIVSIVIAPIDLAFLIPIVTTFWGWFLAGFLNLIGWTIGSAVVFVLCRKFGVPLIKRFVPLEKIYKYVKLMPDKHIFAQIILLRLIIPIDIVSYAIGLFTKVRFVPFIIATFIGFLPLAFILTYLGTLPYYLQIIGFIALIVIFIIGLLSAKYLKKRKKIFI
jgi:uncharacterized membrane protein YdjX (TVP38/TMEM64 family)